MNLTPLTYPQDVRDLTIAQRRAVVQALRDLQEGRRAGKTLAPAAAHQRFRARLAGLMTLPVYTTPGDTEDRHHEACRIVYRLKGDEIDVVAIGPRRGSEVYQTAAERLNPRRRPRRMRR